MFTATCKLTFQLFCKEGNSQWDEWKRLLKVHTEGQPVKVFHAFQPENHQLNVTSHIVHQIRFDSMVGAIVRLTCLKQRSTQTFIVLFDQIKHWQLRGVAAISWIYKEQLVRYVCPVKQVGTGKCLGQLLKAININCEAYLVALVLQSITFPSEHMKSLKAPLHLNCCRLAWNISDSLENPFGM